MPLTISNFSNSVRNKYDNIDNHITEHTVQILFNKHTSDYNISIRDLRNSYILGKLHPIDIKISEHSISSINTNSQFLQIA